MNFKKLMEELKGLLKQKKFANALAGILCLGILLIAFDVLSPQIEKLVRGNGEVTNEATVKETSGGTVLTYEDKQKEDLKNILSQIKGVGSVDVFITYEGGEKKEIAYDSTVQVANTEETDTEGGKRLNKTENQGDKVVMSSENGGTKPFVVETKKPRVTSVMVVADGAGNTKVKYDLQKAVGDLFDVSLDKVNVFSKNS
ncbi:MAG: stage III sporulation protein AG [Clostridium sp.]